MEGDDTLLEYDIPVHNSGRNCIWEELATVIHQ